MDSISDKVKKIRVEYEDKPLNLEDLNQDPLEQFNTCCLLYTSDAADEE